MSDVLLILPVFLLSVLLTGGVRAYALRTQMLAVPNARSSHAQATPVGGGLALVLAYAAALCLLILQGRLPLPESLALATSLPVALIGFVDDRRELGYRVRLAVQAAVVLIALLLLGRVPALPIGSVVLGSVLLTFLLAPLSLLWLTNLYNFMDGIDGLAGSETAFVSLAAAGMLLAAGDRALALPCLFLFAGSVGFLVWNWPTARIFMGDVGSGFVGMSLGLIALLSHYHGSMSLWSWFLLLAVFVVDATVTLLRRTLRGQRWSQAHRQHAYQHMAVGQNGHKNVSLGVLGLNLLYLLPLAIAAGKHPEYGVYFGVLGVIPLVLLALYSGAGREAGRR
ncbi:MAG: glycosyltransferase family 4 protein [Pseudomonadales bacterium]|nr:glycosyltransferase family 4 protein [Pseudomonadales bacterium]MCP5358134.1 glycosyltransferase family 4 protein [Pseudomonadales bacterium]